MHPRSPLTTPKSTRRSTSPLPSLQSQLTLDNPSTRNVFQSIVQSRKSWKTVRGGEVVWPPELEAALIEGLEAYTPNDSRETRILGRFPMRNRFISDYIFRKTGKRRTAKQVGSRLQQLRDTCGGKQLLQLLTPYKSRQRARSVPQNEAESSTTSAHGHCDSDSNSDVSLPSTPTEVHATLQTLLYRGVGGLGRDEECENIIYVDLLPNSMPSNSDVMRPPIASPSAAKAVRVSHRPRHISEIDPNVTLVARSSLNAKSHFIVHSRRRVVHTETTTMKLVGPVPGSDEGELLYGTTLVPRFWKELCQSSDPTQYTISQRVVQDQGHDTSSCLFSATYKFTYPFLTSTSPNEIFQDVLASDNVLIQGSPNMGFNLEDFLSFDSNEPFNDIAPFDSKYMDLYDLNVSLPSDWRSYSPTASSSGDSCMSEIPYLEDALMSSPSVYFADIPVIPL